MRLSAGQFDQRRDRVVGESSSSEPRHGAALTSSTRRTRHWLLGGSLVGFALFVAWQTVATAQKVARGDSPSVIWAVAVGIGAAILFIVATIAMMTWPQRLRLSRLRARYPSQLVLPVARVEGSELAIATVAEVGNRRLGDHYVVVITERRLEFWAGSDTSLPWATIETSRIEDVAVLPGVCGHEVPALSFRVGGDGPSQWIQVAPTYEGVRLLAARTDSAAVDRIRDTVVRALKDR